MKKIFVAVLMLNVFVSPFLLLELQKPPKKFDLIEPVDMNDICGGLENVEYRGKIPEFVDVRAYLEELEERESALALDTDFDEPQTENWADYDILKEDDFIEEPSFYGYSYNLTVEERTVMHEAGWCPDYRLLILTAQCFRNDCELNSWRPAETFKKCGYAAMSYANPRVEKAVQDVFDDGVQCVPEKIFCYYNRNMVYSAEHERNRLAIDIDGNRFFY